MITLISLHNHTYSTKIAVTMNRKVNWSLTRDTFTIYIVSCPDTGVALTMADICHVIDRKKDKLSLNMSALLIFGKKLF